MIPAIALIQHLMGQEGGHNGNVGQIMMLLRMARLLRILRLVRLVKNIPPLFNLIVGIAQAMQGMMWVVILTVVLLYAIALVGVKTIGHGMVLGPGAPEEVKGVFPNVCDSIFVLFKAMNGDWGALEPLFEVLPISKLVLCLYTVISTWGILSILTAVVSENMINATDAQRSEQEKLESDEEDRQKEEQLRNLFRAIDKDCSTTLSEPEYKKMLKDENLRTQLETVTGLEYSELRKLFDYLSYHPDDQDLPIITEKHFVEGLKVADKCEIKERTVMRLEENIRRLEMEMRLFAGDVLKEPRSHGALISDVMRFLDHDNEKEEDLKQESEFKV